MPYRVPNFNLTCNIGPSSAGAGVWPPTVYPAPRLSAVPCALVFGRRTNVASTGGTSDQGFPLECMNLLVAKLTDVRSMASINMVPDVVECPAGSGRYYGVASVDDIGKGYPNEHRTACVMALVGTWTPPYP